MKILKIVYAIISIVFLVYLSIPSPQFPIKPEDSIQSQEAADTESPLRRAYFTNFSRQEVLDWYASQMIHIVPFSMPKYRLNYPPEESQVIIRDQTRSTFLEEIVVPFRESLYVSGFEPKEDKDTIFIENRKWRQKVIVRYVPSRLIYRLVIGLMTLMVGYVLLVFLYKSLLESVKVFRNIVK